MEQQLVKQDIDAWLDNVDYHVLNSANYVPSEFALLFMNFIKLVNGGEGESHKTPPVHLKMLDKLTEGTPYIVNLCFRGAAKALSLDTRILTETGWKTIADLNVGECIYGEDGQPTKIIAKSDIFTKPMYRIQLRDGRSLDVSEDHINVIIHRRVKRVNGKCKTYYERREVTTKELLDIPLGSTRTPNAKSSGWEQSVWVPNCNAVDLPEADLEIDPYVLGLILGDGSISKESGMARLHAHCDDMPHYLPYFDYGNIHTDKRNANVQTVSVLGSGKYLKKVGLNVHGDHKFIPTEYLHGSIDQRLALLQGLMDTDGTVNKTTPSFASNSVQLAEGVMYLVYSLGGTATLTQSKTASGKIGYRVSINLDMPVFRLPRKLAKRTARVLGKVAIDSIEAIPMCQSQCIAVDNSTHTFLAGDFVVTHNTSLFMEYFSLFAATFQYIPGFGSFDGMIYVSDSMDNGVKSARKNIEFRYNNSEFLQKWLPEAKFTDAYIEFKNLEGKPFGIKMFGAKTGIRGTKIFGKRPVIAVLDDLISDDDARSKASMDLIKETVYSGINHALDTTRRKVIFNGTPFNKTDVIIEAVESGGWDVNVWPVCEKFPCTREEFVGAWPDRFSYDYVLEQYNLAKSTGHLPSFYQELMLRISSEDERLIQNDEIRWYRRQSLLQNKGYYNFYITTDFATSAKQSADWTVISVWAYNANGDWFWVDGFMAKTTMDITIEKLFELVATYQPQSVGIEITGQQGGFIQWLQSEMQTRNQWFNFASSEKSGAPGIRPVVDKLARFNLTVPWFKAGKVYFPAEMKTTDIMKEFMQEIRLALVSGLKGKDDCLDTISMLVYLKPWRPTMTVAAQDQVSKHSSDIMWEKQSSNDSGSNNLMDSYIV